MAKKMSYELRKKIILDLLNEQEIITIPDVVKKCNVSEITIRRDLINIGEEGLLVRTHGGALKPKN